MLRSIFVVIALLVLPAQAFAMSLDEAKAQGLVGERVDGYLGPVVESAEVIALVKDINNQRRAEYARIAAGNGQPLDVIQKLAAQKAYEKTPSGFYVQNTSGAWVKK
ncbi:MAG: YdbL family protein [Alphaproteobacteria bacterium]|nr:YdbL family protein [Alphaproteobacteria bacterium]